MLDSLILIACILILIQGFIVFIGLLGIYATQKQLLDNDKQLMANDQLMDAKLNGLKRNR